MEEKIKREMTAHQWVVAAALPAMVAAGLAAGAAPAWADEAPDAGAGEAVVENASGGGSPAATGRQGNVVDAMLAGQEAAQQAAADPDYAQVAQAVAEGGGEAAGDAAGESALAGGAADGGNGSASGDGQAEGRADADASSSTEDVDAAAGDGAGSAGNVDIPAAGDAGASTEGTGADSGDDAAGDSATGTEAQSAAKVQAAKHAAKAPAKAPAANARPVDVGEGQQYATISAAIEALKAAPASAVQGVFNVVSNIAEASLITIGEGMDILITGNGYTVTFSSGGFVVDGGELTLGNGQAASASNGITIAGNGTLITVKNGGTFALRDGATVGAEGKTGTAISVARDETKSADGTGTSTYHGEGGAVNGSTYLYANSDGYIKDGSYTNNGGTALQVEGHLSEISGGTFTTNATTVNHDSQGNPTAGYLVHVKGGKIDTISGGTMTTNASHGLVISNGGRVGVISGGSFTSTFNGHVSDTTSGRAVHVSSSRSSDGTPSTIGTISGGTFNGHAVGLAVSARFDYAQTTSAVDSITGGTFIGGSRGVSVDQHSKVGTISGGTFQGSRGLWNFGVIDEISGGIYESNDTTANQWSESVGLQNGYGRFTSDGVEIKKITGGTFKGFAAGIKNSTYYDQASGEMRAAVIGSISGTSENPLQISATGYGSGKWDGYGIYNVGGQIGSISYVSSKGLSAGLKNTPDDGVGGTVGSIEYSTFTATAYGGAGIYNTCDVESDWSTNTKTVYAGSIGSLSHVTVAMNDNGGAGIYNDGKIGTIADSDISSNNWWGTWGIYNTGYRYDYAYDDDGNTTGWKTGEGTGAIEKISNTKITSKGCGYYNNYSIWFGYNYYDAAAEGEGIYNDGSIGSIEKATIDAGNGNYGIDNRGGTIESVSDTKISTGSTYYAAGYGTYTYNGDARTGIYNAPVNGKGGTIDAITNVEIATGGSNGIGIENEGTIDKIDGGTITVDSTGSQGNGIVNKGTITDILNTTLTLDNVVDNAVKNLGNGIISNILGVTITGSSDGIYNQGTIGKVGASTAASDDGAGAKTVRSTITTRNCGVFNYRTIGTITATDISTTSKTSNRGGIFNDGKNAAITTISDVTIDTAGRKGISNSLGTIGDILGVRTRVTNNELKDSDKSNTNDMFGLYNTGTITKIDAYEQEAADGAKTSIRSAFIEESNSTNKNNAGIYNGRTTASIGSIANTTCVGDVYGAYNRYGTIDTIGDYNVFYGTNKAGNGSVGYQNSTSNVTKIEPSLAGSGNAEGTSRYWGSLGAASNSHAAGIWAGSRYRDATGTLPNTFATFKNAEYPLAGADDTSSDAVRYHLSYTADPTGGVYKTDVTADSPYQADYQGQQFQYLRLYHKLSYDKNADAATGEVKPHAEAEDAEKIKIAANGYARAGWRFAGWNTEADGTGMAYSPFDENSSLDSPDGTWLQLLDGKDAVLYAQWAPYELKYHKNADAATGEMGSQTSGKVDPAVSIAKNAFARAGWFFTGWNTAADGAGTAYAAGDIRVLTEDADVYAQWEPFKLVYDANGDGASGAMDPSVPAPEGSHVTVSPNAFARAGYEFAGWNTEADGTGESYAAGDERLLDADATVYAQWRKAAEPAPAKQAKHAAATAVQATVEPAASAQQADSAIPQTADSADPAVPAGFAGAAGALAAFAALLGRRKQGRHARRG